MFGISFSELCIVIVVALILLRPKDLPYIVKVIKSIHKKFNKLKNEFLTYYNEFHEEITESKDDIEGSNYILDDNGVLQRAYDISDFKKKSVVRRKRTAPVRKNTR